MSVTTAPPTEVADEVPMVGVFEELMSELPPPPHAVSAAVVIRKAAARAFALQRHRKACGIRVSLMFNSSA